MLKTSIEAASGEIKIHDLVSQVGFLVDQRNQKTGYGGFESWKRRVWSLHQKDIKRLTEWTEGGRKFCNFEPATEKAWEVNTIQVQGTSRVTGTGQFDDIQYLLTWFSFLIENSKVTFKCISIIIYQQFKGNC